MKGVCNIQLRAISQEVLLNFIRNMCLEIKKLKSVNINFARDLDDPNNTNICVG